MKMAQGSIEINGNLHSTQIWHGETYKFKSLYNVVDVENLDISDKNI